MYSSRLERRRRIAPGKSQAGEAVVTRVVRAIYFVLIPRSGNPLSGQERATWMHNADKGLIRDNQ